MYKKHIFLRVFSKIAIFACVFCAFFISPVFATLPAGYTELEYIESAGTQYIDLGMPVGSREKLTFDINFSSISKFAFGSYSLAFDYRGDITVGGDWVGSISDFVGGIEGRHTIKWNGLNAKPTVDGVEFVVYLTPPYDDVTPTTNAYLFARNNRGEVYSWGKYAIYGFEVEGKMKLVPARRNSDNEIGMYDTVSDTFFTNSGIGSFIAGPDANCKTVGTDGVTCTACKSGYKVDSNGWCIEIIEIARTKFVDEEFAAAEAKLATTVQTIESVVSRTIAQTGQIATLQEEKQTRPDEICAVGKKCLLVTDENGTPHWYEIIEPAPAFNAVAFLNQVINPEGDNYYYAGNTTTYNELGGGSYGVEISQPPASSGLRQLNETEWVVQWNDKGAVYGTSVCSGNGGRVREVSSIEQTETKGGTCWCKVTSVGDLDGVEHGVLSSAWGFGFGFVSAVDECAESCAYFCANRVSHYEGTRAAVLGAVNF